jgi:hypothetical protein
MVNPRGSSVRVMGWIGLSSMKPGSGKDIRLFLSIAIDRQRRSFSDRKRANNLDRIEALPSHREGRCKLPPTTLR